MTKYLIKQVRHDIVGDDTAYSLRRGNVEKTKELLAEGLVFRDSAYINADGLNEVFEIGNIHHHLVDRLDKFYSISVGDVIVNTDTQECYLVMPIGFSELGNIQRIRYEGIFNSRKENA